jgi:hypothetical protein
VPAFLQGFHFLEVDRQHIENIKKQLAQFIYHTAHSPDQDVPDLAAPHDQSLEMERKRRFAERFTCFKEKGEEDWARNVRQLRKKDNL